MNDSLFNRYSKNLEIHSNLKNSFVCPICLDTFQRQEIGKLTVEHIIPKSLGGKMFVITCKKCNNYFGSKYISKLNKNLEVKDTLSGQGNKPIETTLNILGKKFNAEYIPKDDIETFTIQQHRNNPCEIEKIKNGKKISKNDEIKVNFNLGPTSNFPRLSYLLTAHLILFYYFGYYYLLNSSGLYIQNTIINENHESFLCNNFNFTGNKEIRKLIEEDCLLIRPKKIINNDNKVIVLLPYKTDSREYIIGLLSPCFPGEQIQEKSYTLGRHMSFDGIGIAYNQEYIDNPPWRLPGGKYHFAI